MAFCEYKYFSDSLGHMTAANLIVPEKAEPPFGVFYLLHGLTDDHTGWMRRSSIERYVDGLPLLVVMPDGGRGFYTDAHTGPPYESALIKDLLPLIDRTFPTRLGDGEVRRCIGGLSMGGYGAIKLALKHPRLFCSATSHSGSVSFAHDLESLMPELDAEFRLILGTEWRAGSNDCYTLASNLMTLPADQRPKLRLDCGTDDFLLPSNREFDAHLTEIDYAHEYEEFSGDHTWDYWDMHVRDAIQFHMRNLQLT